MCCSGGTPKSTFSVKSTIIRCLLSLKCLPPPSFTLGRACGLVVKHRNQWMCSSSGFYTAIIFGSQNLNFAFKAASNLNPASRAAFSTLYASTTHSEHALCSSSAQGLVCWLPKFMKRHSQSTKTGPESSI